MPTATIHHFFPGDDEPGSDDLPAASRKLAAQAVKADDENLAVRLAVTAYGLAPTPQARAALLDVGWSLTELAKISGHTNTVYGVAFSPDGKTLATTSKDNFVRLWDVADPHHPHLLFEQPSHDSTAALLVAFGPDGKTLATTSYDRIAWLWDLDPANLARRACTTPTNRITPDEWRHYLRNVPYRAPC